jgi:hypothetical protein
MTLHLRFAAITILVLFGARLFAVDASSGYVLGMGAALVIVWLYRLAVEMETR